MNPMLGRVEKEVVDSGWTGLRRITVLPAVFFLLFASSVVAQDAVPIEILQRTLRIKVGERAATAFTIDYQGKLYLVTAKHVVAGLPQNGATIQVWRSDKWVDFKTVKTLFPPSTKADIAVFETDQKVPPPFQITGAQGKEGPTFGQQVWFLGYPGGLGSRFSNGQLPQLPFIKRGTMSAMDSSDLDAVLLYIDGFNNPGFSGGPIVYWDFGSRAYRILGVVQGYRTDTAMVLVNGVPVETHLLVNSGILVGYSIEHVFQAIRQGQKRP
jgi:S1-C subfamily serine protease